MVSDPSNDERAAVALAALESQEKYHDHPDGLGEMIVSLVTDLLHLAREKYIEPDYVIHTAQMHFDAEVQEEMKNGGQDSNLSQP